MMIETTMMAAAALTKPCASVIAPPIASSARNEIAPIAVCAILSGDQRRALLAVNLSA
jgi:hypothetical protein